MKIYELFEQRRYAGDPLEAGGTSIAGGAAPALKQLATQPDFKNAETILDYGAGRFARNANYLREQGYRVYAYDPFNGAPDGDGWNVTSQKKPAEQFDVGFTSFVLNVVPEHIEKSIIEDLKQLAKTSYHITRNKDIFDMVKKALSRREPTVTNFFLNNFADEEERQAFEEGRLTDKIIQDFCEHGVQTSRGFQRIPTSEDSGLTLIKSTSGYKVYKG